MLFSCASSDDSVNIIPTNPDSENPTNIRPEAIVYIDINDQPELGFGKRVSGKVKIQTIIVKNTGDVSLEVSSIDIPDAYIANWNSGSISAGGSQEVKITFSPTEVKVYEGTLTINSNAKNNENSINLQGFGVGEIYDGHIALGNQNDVNDFGAIGYTKITGELCIGKACYVDVVEPNVVDLSALNGMLSVSTLKVNTNPELETLEGLNNTKIETYLSILFNNNLKDLDAILDMPFNVLPAGFQITGNSVLQNIDGLQKISSVGGIATILENDELKNIDGLSNLISIGGSLRISRNQLITNLNGLSSLEIVEGNISFRNNTELYDYCGIKMLLEIGGNATPAITTVFNRYNPSINDIVNANCEYAVPSGTYYGDLSLYRQDDIDLFAESGYSKFVGNLTYNGFDITDFNLSFEGLSTLTEITGSLNIINTQSLVNLTGFENLTSVGGDIDISRNIELADFCSLVPLMQNTSGFSGNYTAQNNSYNPSQQELENETCSP